MTHPFISVAAPAHNEEGSIEEFVRRCHEALRTMELTELINRLIAERLVLEYRIKEFFPWPFGITVVATARRTTRTRE
jgi:hypothetical protein